MVRIYVWKKGIFEKESAKVQFLMRNDKGLNDEFLEPTDNLLGVVFEKEILES